MAESKFKETDPACSRCAGTGQVQEPKGAATIIVTCPTCKGEGRTKGGSG